VGIVIHSHVDLLDSFACHDLARLALADFSAVVQDNEPIHDSKQGMNHMFDPDDRDSALVDAPNCCDELMAFFFGQSAGDLVEEKQFWPRRKGTGHFQPFAIEQAQAAGRCIGLCSEPGSLQYLATVTLGCALAFAAPKIAPTSRFS
jgi:hypothetical protein